MTSASSWTFPKLRFSGFSDEWEVKKLGDIADVFDGTHQTPKYVKQGIPFYSVEHLTADQFENTKYVSEDVFIHENERVKISKGDILMTRIGDIGTARYIDWDATASFYVSLALIKQSTQYNGAFLAKYIATDIFQRELWRRTIHVAFPKKINLGEISNCLVKLPNQDEQQKIADFLTSVYDKIAAIDKKVELLKKYKKGVMQKIFAQQVRFKDEEGSYYPEWVEQKLGDVLAERKTYMSKGGELEHISLTTVGVVPKTARYERDFLVSSGSDKNYKITRFNDICYNPANLKFGVIARNKYGDGIFSPIYVTFEVKGENDIEFMEYFLTRNNFIERARKYEQGTVYERMAVSPSDFIKLSVSLPLIDEQQKIADLLSAIDDKIKTEEDRLTAAKKFKSALSQRMFV